MKYVYKLGIVDESGRGTGIYLTHTKKLTPQEIQKLSVGMCKDTKVLAKHMADKPTKKNM